MPVFLGGLLRWAAEKRAPNEEEAGERRERGVLFGSGLVGGEGLLGVAIAGAVAFYYRDHAPAGIGTEWAGAWAPLAGLAAMGLLAWYLWHLCHERDD